ncbi:MAG TPA: hypothetical protein VH877_05285 [Polyangia bacterium]|nr:hypothetical protein [Polyangia bacterium]
MRLDTVIGSALSFLTLTQMACFGVRDREPSIEAAAERTAAVAGASPRINSGGTNYVLYSLGDDDPTNNNRFYLPALNVRPVVGTYDLAPGTVQTQIAAMRTSGQSDFLLDIFFADFTATGDPDGRNDNVYGHLVNSQTGQLSALHQQNLNAILNYVKGQGFKRVVVRFAPSGGSDPLGWTYVSGAQTWNEAIYQNNWNFIANTRTLIKNNLQGSGIDLLVDLGVEQAGVDFIALGQRARCADGTCQGKCPDGDCYKEYLRHLYGDYLTTYGAADTMGFSFVAEGWRISKMISWYSQWQGQYGWSIPAYWAASFYDNTGTGGTSVYTKLRDVYSALGSRNGQAVILLETDQNDSNVANSLSQALNDPAMPYLNLEGVFQWPHLRTRPQDINFSVDAIAALSQTTQFSNYTPLRGSRRADIFNSDTTRLALTDFNCRATTGSLCTVNYVTGSAPAGSVYVVQVTSTAGTGVVSCASAPQSVSPSWIQSNLLYTFNAYQVSSCNASLTPNTLVASATVRVRN